MKATALINLEQTLIDGHVQEEPSYVRESYIKQLNKFAGEVANTSQGNIRVKLNNFKQYVKFSQFCKSKGIKYGTIEVHKLKPSKVLFVSLSLFVVLMAFSGIMMMMEGDMAPGIVTLLLGFIAVIPLNMNYGGKKLGYLTAMGILNPFNGSDVLIDEAPTKTIITTKQPISMVYDHKKGKFTHVRFHKDDFLDLFGQVFNNMFWSEDFNGTKFLESDADYPRGYNEYQHDFGYLSRRDTRILYDALIK